MKSIRLGYLVLAALVGCGSSAPATQHTSAAGSSTTGASAATGGGIGAGGTTSGGGTTGSSCLADGTALAAGQTALHDCCSKYAENGICTVPGGGTTSSSGTTGASGSAGTSTNGGSGSSGASTTSSGGTTSGGASSTTTSSGGTTGGACYGDGLYVGPGASAMCCSGYTDSNGYCAQPGTTSSGNTSGTTTGGTSTSGGTTGGGSCPASCYSARGYHCENGQCVLNGGDGQLQFTLQWDSSLNPTGRAAVDLDLHVVEPSNCEIMYPAPGNPACVGRLDLDSNAGCSDSSGTSGFGADTENIIYPPDGGAPHGTYQVIVDDWADSCDTGANPFNWKLTIRNGSQDTTYTGQFTMGDADHSGALAGARSTTGHKVFSFTY